MCSGVKHERVVRPRELLPLNRRMKTSFQIASAFPQVRSLKLRLLSSWGSCWYESGTNRAEVRTRQFWQCSGGSRKRMQRRLLPRASSPCLHGCKCPWRSASWATRMTVSPQVSIASPTSTSKALFFLNGLNQCSFENEYVPRVGIVAMLDKQCLNVYDMQRSRIAERIGCTNTVFYPLRRGGPDAEVYVRAAPLWGS